MSQALAKQENLFASLRRLDSLLVAFSGGADSAYLAWAAHQILADRALAITALSASFSRHDRQQAENFIAATGLRHQFIETRELENPLYVANNADRCYHCKDELFDQMDSLARSRQFAAIAYGINADDTRDFRPGHRAAHEHHVLAPLLDAELTKSEIRFLSQRAGLSTWNRPASACLSSRVPYGTAVTPELLDKIDRAEAVLRASISANFAFARTANSPESKSRSMNSRAASMPPSRKKSLTASNPPASPSSLSTWKATVRVRSIPFSNSSSLRRHPLQRNFWLRFLVYL